MLIDSGRSISAINKDEENYYNNGGCSSRGIADSPRSGGGGGQFEIPRSLLMYNQGVKRKKDQEKALHFYRQRVAAAEEQGERPTQDRGHTLEFYLRKYRSACNQLLERHATHNQAYKDTIHHAKNTSQPAAQSTNVNSFTRKYELLKTECTTK